jgi:hypothetical protein
MRRNQDLERGTQRSYYRPVAIALVAVALVSTSFIIMVIVGIAMSMRSMGNK